MTLSDTILAIAGSALAQDVSSSPAAPATKSVLQYIFAGGIVGYILIILSFVAVTLTIMHLLEVRLSRLAPTPVVERLRQLLQAHDVDGAAALCASDENHCFLTKVFGAALERCGKSPFGFLEFRSALEEAGGREVDDLNRTTDAIGLIAAVGPMLGLLGTVFGMIGAFATIGQAEGAARSQQLAGFMSLALVATAQGLVVAIPCTVIYALFRRRVDRLTGRVGHILEDLAVHLEGGGTPAAASRPRPVATRETAPKPTAVAGVRAS